MWSAARINTKPSSIIIKIQKRSIMCRFCSPSLLLSDIKIGFVPFRWNVVFILKYFFSRALICLSKWMKYQAVWPHNCKIMVWFPILSLSEFLFCQPLRPQLDMYKKLVIHAKNARNLNLVYLSYHLLSGLYIFNSVLQIQNLFVYLMFH